VQPILALAGNAMSVPKFRTIELKTALEMVVDTWLLRGASEHARLIVQCEPEEKRLGMLINLMRVDSFWRGELERAYEWDKLQHPTPKP